MFIPATLTAARTARTRFPVGADRAAVPVRQPGPGPAVNVPAGAGTVSLSPLSRARARAGRSAPLRRLIPGSGGGGGPRMGSAPARWGRTGAAAGCQGWIGIDQQLEAAGLPERRSVIQEMASPWSVMNGTRWLVRILSPRLGRMTAS